jgi:hypothetical protein
MTQMTILTVSGARWPLLYPSGERRGEQIA